MLRTFPSVQAPKWRITILPRWTPPPSGHSAGGPDQGCLGRQGRRQQCGAAEANVPRGGLDWDGRANTLQLQALGPLLDPNEMDNHSASDVLDRLEHAAYADDIKKLFGANIFNQRELALDEALFALARFQTEDPSFHPYDSKYDAVLAGKAVLSEAEARGLKLFDDPKKGNCSSCHIDRATLDGVFRPAFTDFQFEALGAPRNRDIPANRDPHFYDLGLCGPMRKDYASAAAYCGLFKTPTLRNTATRKVFFHNGVFHSLEEVMHFYVERETDPAKWYPKLAGMVRSIATMICRRSIAATSILSMRRLTASRATRPR